MTRIFKGAARKFCGLYTPTVHLGWITLCALVSPRSQQHPQRIANSLYPHSNSTLTLVIAHQPPPSQIYHHIAYCCPKAVMSQDAPILIEVSPPLLPELSHPPPQSQTPLQVPALIDETIQMWHGAQQVYVMVLRIGSGVRYEGYQRIRGLPEGPGTVNWYADSQEIRQNPTNNKHYHCNIEHFI
jgi:hypothetical protein